MFKLYMMALASGLVSILGLGVSTYVLYETRDWGIFLAVACGFAFIVAFLKPDLP